MAESSPDKAKATATAGRVEIPTPGAAALLRVLVRQCHGAEALCWWRAGPARNLPPRTPQRWACPSVTLASFRVSADDMVIRAVLRNHRVAPGSDAR